MTAASALASGARAQSVPDLCRRAAVASAVLLAFAMISFDQMALPIISSPTVLLGAATFALTVLSVVATGRARPLSPILVVVYAFLLWSIATLVWSAAPQNTFVRARTYLQVAIMMWAIYESAARECDQIAIMRAIALGAIPVSAQTIWNFMHKVDVASVVFDAAAVDGFQQRYSAYGYNPNELGCVLALTIPFGVYLAIRSRGPAAALSWVQIGIAALATVVTGSRGGMITAAVALLYVPIAFFRFSRAQRVFCVLCLLGLVSYLIVKPPTGARERLMSIRSEVKSGTMTGRTVLWKNSLRVFAEHPVQGVGAAAVEKVMSRFTGRSDLISHNTFLSVLSETGLVGFLLFVFAAASILVCALEMPYDERLLWMMVLLTLAVGLISITFEQRKHIWFIAALAAAHAARRRDLHTVGAESARTLGAGANALAATA